MHRFKSYIPSHYLLLLQSSVSGRGSAVEHRLAKARVVGSIPIVRSIFYNIIWRHSQVVRHSSAKALSPVRIWVAPPVIFKILAPLAQLDRAFDYESKGQEFESLRVRHFSSYVLNGSNKKIVSFLISRCGGIGRRARLKIVRETVGVRVPSPAYTKKSTRSFDLVLFLLSFKIDPHN